MGLTPLTFTGLSQFSTDFQTILTRAVSIAQLPITALQNQQSNLLQEKQLATGLESAMSDLAASVANLGSLGSNQSLATSSSDTSKVVVNNSSLTTPASYTITNISSVASAASATTTTGYADATTANVSGTGTMQLKINGVAVTPNITLDGAHNNLNGLRDAINALNAGVTASVISTGTGATPYYLSISANATGQNAITLFDDPNGANTQVPLNGNAGANADFYVNGAHVTSPTNVISNVISGVTFSIVGQTSGAQAVTLSAASDSSQLSAGLQDFVTKYNAVGTLLDAQIGTAAGLLTGNSLIYGIQGALRGLVNYNGTGNTKSLSDLGIELDSSGKMSLNQSDTTNRIAFNSLSLSQISDAFSFLGSATTGFGGLSASLAQFSDPFTGTIKAQQDQFDTTYNTLTDRINMLTSRANSMQASLNAKLQAADARVAQMQSQQQLLTATIQGLNFSSFGFQNTNTATNNHTVWGLSKIVTRVSRAIAIA
jgi:flagellar hook-associated protein 2